MRLQCALLPCLFTLGALSTSLSVAAAQESGNEPKSITLTPMPAPSPALKHRLLPLESELVPGNAAPIYLRLNFERSDPYFQADAFTKDEWREMPIDELPVDEVRAAVKNVIGSAFEQLVFATRRDRCDWEYTLDDQRERSFEILLPDAQGLRVWSRFLTTKARLEIAERRFEDAIETTRTAIVMGRNMAEAPFLINALVGTAYVNFAFGCLEDFVTRPGAPNLYWALTALPEKPIAMRRGFEHEQKFVDWVFPELTGLVEADLTDAEWDARLVRFHRRLVDLDSDSLGGAQEIPLDVPENFREFRNLLVEDYRADHPEAGPDDPKAISLLFHISDRHQQVAAELYKATYLPYPQALPIYRQWTKTYPIDDLPMAQRVLSLIDLFPSIEAGHWSETRLARRLALLRVLEAIRIHAAESDGQLPANLQAITAVPVPIDPATGGSFRYQLEGTSALLSTPEVDRPKYESPLAGSQEPSVAYRITIAPTP